MITVPSWHIRRSSAEDLPAILRLYDEAVVWLNGRGITDQWGTTPVSIRPHLVAEVGDSLTSGFVAEDKTIAGFIALELGTPEGIAVLLSAEEGETGAYVHSLVARRTPEAHGVGAALLDFAARLCLEHGKACLRLTCSAGNPRLVAYYERVGFKRHGGADEIGSVLLERRL